MDDQIDDGHGNGILLGKIQEFPGQPCAGDPRTVGRFQGWSMDDCPETPKGEEQILQE